MHHRRSYRKPCYTTGFRSLAWVTTIPTCCGGKFIYKLFRRFKKLPRCTHIMMTAYHLLSDSLVGQFHCRSKVTLTFYENLHYRSNNLSLVPLDIRPLVTEDLQCTTAEVVFRAPIRFPGEYFYSSPSIVGNEAQALINWATGWMVYVFRPRIILYIIIYTLYLLCFSIIIQ